MKKKNIFFTLIVLTLLLVVVNGFSKSKPINTKSISFTELNSKEQQVVNMFVTHGHCSLPFTGKVDDLNITLIPRIDLGNPLEGMKISFDIDPNSFVTCIDEDQTAKIKTQGLFVNSNNQKITFRTTSVFTMGLDWYQINGKMSIKGVEKEMKFFATGIKNSINKKTNLLILEGQINLFDWGINYDKIVSGKFNDIPTKWMHFNMKINII